MFKFVATAGLILALSLLVPLPVMSQEYAPQSDDLPEYARWSVILRGSYRNLFLFQHTDEFMEDSGSSPAEKNMAADLNRLSFSPEISYGDSLTFHADVDVEAIFSNYNGTMPFGLYWSESDYNDFTKPSVEPFDNSIIYLTAEIRNIYAKMSKGPFTGTAGRQQVRFGSSRLWNPLDLLNPFSPVHVEGGDEQKGIDALRLDWYPGESTELTCVVNPVREHDAFTETGLRSSNYAARFKTGVTEFDLALIAAYTARRVNCGMDFQFILFDGMLTGAVLWSDPDEGKSYVQCGAGYEYTFSSGIYFLAEYFYNGLPVNEDRDLSDAMQGTASGGIGGEN